MNKHLTPFILSTLTNCAHEAEWRPASTSAARAAIHPAAEGSVSAAPTAGVPCTHAAFVARWRGAASDELLCELRPRVRAELSTTESLPRGIIANATRLQLRRIAEKCRADLRLSVTEAGQHARTHVRVLIDPSGAIALVSPYETPDESSQPNAFTRCLIAAIRAESVAPVGDDWYDVVVPPIPLRWWPDARVPAGPQQVW